MKNYREMEVAGKAPVRIFADETIYQGFEHGVFKQAENTACTCGVEHVAILPDAHHGYGAPIGSVVVSSDRVIPGPVGYDIGCFRGETLVPTVDGEVTPIAELAERGQPIWVYAIDQDQRIVVAQATAQLTRRAAPLVEVALDHGQTIACTPDHEFMRRDGTYCRADALEPGTSLMPFYTRKDKEGYRTVKQPATQREQRVHWLMARQGLLGDIPAFAGQRTVIHHRNFHPWDNRPENLEFMGHRDHMVFHHRHGKSLAHFKTEAFREKRLAALAAKAATPEGHEFYAARGTKNLRTYMSERRDHFLAAVAGNGERGKPHLVAYNQSEAGRAKSKEIANRLYTCETCGDQVKSGFGLHNHRRNKHGYNHRVTAVRPLEEVADVYCLTVPGYGNFALDAGVFVHNCGMALYPTEVPAAMLKDRNLRRRVMEAIDRGIAMGEGKDSAHDVAVSKDMMADVLNRGAFALRDRGLIPAGWTDRCERPVHELPDHPKRGAQAFDLAEVPGRAQRGFNQLGTLGGGNHFIELQEVKLSDDPALRAIAQGWGLFDGQLAVMVHSGSRGFGHGLGEWAFETFRARNDREGEEYADKELVHAPVTSPEAKQYMRYVAAGANFALVNRLLMARVVKKAVESVLPNAKLGLLYEISHNLAQWEPDEHGDLKLVHRKGTTRAFPAKHPMLQGTMWADTGHPVITPGSMGTFSAIQVGLPGAAASFFSINHGAGRRMSRAAAKRTLDQGQVDADMDAMDILVNCRHTPLDEAPAVYKDLEEVLGAVRACDLAATVARCYPIGSMKGNDEPRGGHGSAKYKANKKKR